MTEVTQADRDAAAVLIGRIGLSWSRDMIRDGKADGHDYVQAFARHRLARTTGEPVAWMYSRNHKSLPPSVQVNRRDADEMQFLADKGWTETPLYAQPAAGEPVAELASSEISSIFVDFADRQESLGPEFSEALAYNLEELYETSTAAGEPASELVEALEMACSLIQAAKGLAEGPDGGAVTNHLDTAEHWIDKVSTALAKHRSNPNG